MKHIQGKILWSGRKHWAWFPFSFTTYQLTSDRLYQQTGLMNTRYDEALLYKVIDICLRRSLAQKIFGTGTIVLTTRSDAQREIVLKNIKEPLEVRALLSQAIEEERERKKVIGKEFYAAGPMHPHDSDGPDMEDDPDMDDFSPI